MWMNTVRRALAPGIAFESIDDYLDNRRFLVNNLKKRGLGKSSLEAMVLQEVEEFSSFIGEKVCLNPSRSLKNYTSNNFMMMCFGKRWKYNDPEYETFDQMIDKLVEVSTPLTFADIFPTLEYLPKFHKLRNECECLIKSMRNYFEKYVDECEKEEDIEQLGIASDYLKTHKDFDKKKNERISSISFKVYFWRLLIQRLQLLDLRSLI